MDSGSPSYRRPRDSPGPRGSRSCRPRPCRWRRSTAAAGESVVAARVVAGAAGPRGGRGRAPLGELGEEGVGGSARGPAGGAGGGREGGRLGEAGEVGPSRRVDGDPQALIGGPAAEVGRI